MMKTKKIKKDALKKFELNSKQLIQTKGGKNVVKFKAGSDLAP